MALSILRSSSVFPTPQPDFLEKTGQVTCAALRPLCGPRVGEGAFLLLSIEQSQQRGPVFLGAEIPRHYPISAQMAFASARTDADISSLPKYVAANLTRSRNTGPICDSCKSVG